LKFTIPNLCKFLSKLRFSSLRYRWPYLMLSCLDPLVLLLPTLLCNQCLLPLMLWVRISIRTRCTTLCDKVCTWLATGRWFSPGSPVSSTNKTIRNDITEILLKVALNTIKQTSNYLSYQSFAFERTWWRLSQKRVMRIKVDIYVFINHDIGVIHNCQPFSKVCKTHAFPDPPPPQKVYINHFQMPGMKINNQVLEHTDTEFLILISFL